MTSIRPLSEAVRSSLRSGIILFDLKRVVEELVFNSLDAGATKFCVADRHQLVRITRGRKSHPSSEVSVFVGVGNCYIKVVDDGAGITRDGLVLVGERYATSKLLNLADLNATSQNFGFRGEALASISEVSLLEIVTRTYGRANGYRKVLKGCKCLFLGIDDDRKEVGTTVVVRDLFYNQPVRRKYMQSSQKKVLQSIKKCMLRLAIVHPNILFKVVDIESEDELLCTHSSSSPLSLLASGFGVEVSSTLRELEFQDDIIKLSGFISGPCNSFTLKALQYVYINSQFICKGPIHKLLNQLATRFEHLDSWNADNKFQNKKRSRSQACPAYILNLSCPRSLYDLTFEPSKTCVQFKDWASILNFIEKAIKQFWEENINDGRSSKYAAYVEQADKLCKAVDNAPSAKADLSKCGNQNCMDCLDLFFPTSDKLNEDDYHLSAREDIRTSFNYLHGGTAKFKEKQNKRNVLYKTGYSSFSLDGSYARRATVTKKHNSLWMYDNNCLPGRDYFLDGKFAAAEIFNDYAFFDAPSSSNGNNYLDIDADGFSELSEGALLSDCHEPCNDIDISGDFQKPFLKSCSTQGSILQEKALFANDEHEFRTDSLRTKQDVDEYCGSEEDLGTQPCTDAVEIFDMPRDSAFYPRASGEENCLPSDSGYSETQIGGSGSDHELLKLELCPLFGKPLSQAAAWDFGQMTGTDLDDLGGIPSYYKRGGYIKILDNEENECNLSRIMSCSSNPDQCTSSFVNTGSYFDVPDDCSKINFTDSRLVEWPDCDVIYSTKWSDILTEESDWFCPDLCGENYKRLSKNRVKRDHARLPAFEKNHERSRRSFSAPPFHRSKRRFCSLNQPSTIIAKRPVGQTSNHALKDRGADESKLPQQSSGALHPSSEEHLLLDQNSNMKQRPNIAGDTQVNNIREFDGLQSFNSQGNAPFKELISRKLQDSIDYRTKWRDCSPQFPKNDKSLDFQSQNNILDISSGFLHLAGDSLIPETISKKDLEDARVLHQVDKKFIPVVAGRTLAVIDQHAADERIRLEELRQKVLSGEAKTINYLDAEQELVLPEIGYQLLYNYSDQIKDWGWICNIHTLNSKSFKQNLDILNKQPVVITLIAVPCILGVKLNDADLMEFLQQLADTDGSSTMPPSVIRVLNLKACRGAIMFGDSLLPSECSLLVEELKHTSLCFQCAHGRPTTVPLVNLEALHNQVAKLGLMNDCSNNKWHGLQRHKVSVERAEQRLFSARE